MARIRLYRRIPIIPGLVWLNLSKSGVSITIGPRGFKLTLGHGRAHTTVGLPGTGISASEDFPLSRKRRKR